MGTPSTAYIGLGSNLGRVQENLERAGGLIGTTPGVTVSTLSQVYYTEPQGVKEQPWFGNLVIAVSCTEFWTAVSFLRRLLSIETLMGRTRSLRWGPRVIDLDLLFFGREAQDTEELRLPHPRIRERAFVLLPLLEIEPDLVFPDGQRGVDALRGLAYRLRGNCIYQD